MKTILILTFAIYSIGVYALGGNPFYTNTYEFSTNTVSIDGAGNIVLNYDVSNNLVGMSTAGATVSYLTESRRTTLYLADEFDCKHGDTDNSFRVMATTTVGADVYVAKEKVCFKQIDPNSYTPFKADNYKMYFYAFKVFKNGVPTTLVLPDPYTIKPLHYKGFAVDNSGNMYVIAWKASYYTGKGSTKIWKFNAAGIEQ